MSESKSTSSGAGFFTLLGLLFIGLKLAGIINWSWWYVTMPLWGGLALVIAILMIAGLVSLILSRYK